MNNFDKKKNESDLVLAKKQVQWKTALHNKNIEIIRRISSTVDEQDLADWIREEPVVFQTFFLRSLKNLQASEVFNVLDEETLANIIRTFTLSETKKLISSLYADDIIDKIEELPSELVYRVLSSITDKQRRDVNYILNYSENTVGYEMNVDFIKTKLSTTVAELIESIAFNEKTKIEQTNRNYYVTNNDNILVGFISSETILSNQNHPKLKISNIMEENVVSVRASDHKNILLKKVNKYNISEFPVVDSQNKLVGVLDAETSFQIFEEESTEDASAAYGITSLESDENYFKTSAWRHFLKRAPWLAITLLISTFSQLILRWAISPLVESSPSDADWLIKVLPYLPFMLALIGTIALQSSGVISKYIVLGQITRINYLRAFLKEMKIVCYTLIFVVFVTFFRNLFIDSIFLPKDSTSIGEQIIDSLFLLLIISLSIIVAAAISSGLPIFATLIKVDPALMASPLLTTLIDLIVTGLSIFLAFLFFR